MTVAGTSAGFSVGSALSRCLQYPRIQTTESREEPKASDENKLAECKWNETATVILFRKDAVDALLKLKVHGCTERCPRLGVIMVLHRISLSLDEKEIFLSLLL